MNRRNLLKLGGVTGAGALMLPFDRIAEAFTGAPAVPVFEVPLTVPPVLRPSFRLGTTEFYDITMRERAVEILPGTRTPIWGYNGNFPGPTIRTRRGRQVIVRQHNKLPEQTAVHLHGANVASHSDGLPGDEIRPGGSRIYYYPNRQPATTLWYHDHVHHNESRHTYLGLAGLYIVTDTFEERLKLPGGDYDVPLIIQDRFFNPDGSFRLPNPGEFFGDVMLVNGRPRPFFEVERRPYRFRLLNASSLDCLLDLSLGSGGMFHVIGSDGGLLPAPVPMSTLPLAPAERLDVVIDFSQFERGARVELRGSIFGAPVDVLRFDVTGKASRHDRLPATLVEVERLRESAATTRREFVLAFDPAAGKMLINGKEFDPNRVDIRPRLGDVEVWTVINGQTAELPIPHVFHTHLVRFQILDRDGIPPAPHEAGWKDSVNVPPGQRVRLIMRFGDFTGRYLYHCHLLGHADLGMMAQMEVVR